MPGERLPGTESWLQPGACAEVQGPEISNTKAHETIPNINGRGCRRCHCQSCHRPGTCYEPGLPVLVALLPAVLAVLDRLCEPTWRYQLATIVLLIMLPINTCSGQHQLGRKPVTGTPTVAAARRTLPSHAQQQQQLCQTQRLCRHHRNVVMHQSGWSWAAMVL